MKFSYLLIALSYVVLSQSSQANPSMSRRQTVHVDRLEAIIPDQKKQGSLALEKKPTLIPAPVEDTSYSESKTRPELVKTCDNQVLLYRLGIPGDVLDSLKNGSSGVCSSGQNLVGAINLGKKATVLGAISNSLRFLTTKLAVDLKSVPDVEQSMISHIVHQVMTQNQSSGSGINTDFYPRITPELIRLMFTLSYLTYYNKNDATFSPNAKSVAYVQTIEKLRLDVANLVSRLDKIKKFGQSLSSTFGDDTIKYIEQRRIRSQEERDLEHQGSSLNKGAYEQKFGLQTPGSENPSFEQHQGVGSYTVGQSSGKDTGMIGKDQTETQDFQVKNFAPDLIREKANTFNAIFGDPDTKIPNVNAVNLEEIEARLSTLQHKTMYDLIEAERSLEILSDPRVGEYWSKVDSTFNRMLQGFKPVDVFYRNLTPYKQPALGKGLAKSKENMNTRIDGKEVSGIMLYREDKSSNGHKVDQLILSFSGSNSQEDWKHNLNFKKTQGYAQHNLAAGFKVHEGIMDSLSESLTYNGTNLKRWFDNYVKSQKGQNLLPGEKPTLRIAVTGHSLGGALALLMALDIKQNIAPHYADKLTIQVVVYTFGSPPIFDSRFAKKAEDLIGKENIVRVWNVGDPVASFSIVKKTEDVFKKSPLMTFLGYSHIGISIPLADNERMASFFDKVNPWSNHLADRYSNLIETNWKSLLNTHAREIFRYLQSQNLLTGEELKSTLEGMDEFLRSNSQAKFALPAKIEPEVIQIVKAQPSDNPKVDKTLKNYQQVVDNQYRQGETSQPKLARADVNGLTYVHQLPTGAEIPMTINRKTSCSVGNIVKQKKLNARQFAPLDLSELSCGCCLSKNYFVSMDSSISSKFRFLFGKKISTVQQVYTHCTKYCAPLVGTVFTDKNRANIDEIGHFMDRMGLGKMWQEKKLR